MAELKDVWQLWFDGLCENTNPSGRMAWGFVLKIPGRDPIKDNGSIPPSKANTNNIAEYLALGFGLRSVMREKEIQPYPGLSVWGDSQLVVEQVNRRWQVNAEHLKKYHARCVELLLELMPSEITWISRENNAEADEQSRLAYFSAEGKMPPTRTNWNKK